MEELINDLEKKQSEISTDIECAIADGIELDFQYEMFADGYEKGFWQGIEKAIEIVKEYENLFKNNDKGVLNMFQVVNEKGVVLGLFYSLYLATVFVEHLKENHNTIATIKEL